MRRHSGLQRDVLSLYRKLLRAASAKGEGTVKAVRDQFRSRAHSVRRRDFTSIEYMLRKGEKDLKTLKMPSFKGVTSIHK
eukprot:g2146.t1